jgi:aldose 1-epimerase
LDADRRNFPTGIKKPWDYFSNGKLLDNSTFYNDCFHVDETGDNFFIEIQQKGHAPKIKLWFETGMGKFNYFQLFIRRGSGEIAIEPMTCAPDAFNSGEGLNYLDPDMSFELKMGIVISIKQ